MDAFKYFINTDDNGIKVKNLCELKPKHIVELTTLTSTLETQTEKAEREQELTYRFVKKYITLNRAEVFFADKIILIEGDTELILLPSMMKK
jgi:predicted ATP-dependent endonuclease of OLD family